MCVGRVSHAVAQWSQHGGVAGCALAPGHGHDQREVEQCGASCAPHIVRAGTPRVRAAHLSRPPVPPRSVARLSGEVNYMEALGSWQPPSKREIKRSNGGRQLCVDAVKGVAAAAGRMSEAEEVERLKKDLDKCNSIIKVSVCASARARACVCV